MSETLYDRAVAGARFLDQHVRGWRKRIRRRELNMEVGTYVYGRCGCVLAQLDEHGDYESMAEILVGDPYGEAAHRLGFMAEDDEYDALTDAWRKVLRENVR